MWKCLPQKNESNHVRLNTGLPTPVKKDTTQKYAYLYNNYKLNDLGQSMYPHNKKMF